MDPRPHPSEGDDSLGKTPSYTATTTATATLSPTPVPQYRHRMAVPGFEVFLLPVLRAYGDGGDLPTVEARARVATAMGLDEADLAERLPNSPQLRATNRINWAQI